MEPVGSATIQVLLQSLLGVASEQASNVLDFKDEFKKMQQWLEFVSGIVRGSVEPKPEEDHNVANTAIRQIRDIMYESDDVIADCMIRQEYQREWSSSWRLFFDDPLFSYKTGKKLKDINRDMIRIQKNFQAFEGLNKARPTERSQREENFSQWKKSTYYSSSMKPFGIEEDLERIKRWILTQYDSSDEDLQRIAIHGMGGLGKTTIASEIVNDTQVMASFDKVIWVCVSRAFNADIINRSILEKLGEETSGVDPSLFLGKIRKALLGKNCLIVMDDVWRINVEWWNHLCEDTLPKKSSVTKVRSCVIITTRNKDVVASMGVEEMRIHQPKRLSDPHDWSLFCRSFGNRRGMIDKRPELETVGREIVKKCGGLPLAIKAMGALLAVKKCGFRDSFHELVVEEDENNFVLSTIRLSYDELSPGLQQSLLCLSVYPQDIGINAEQLIHWWVAEGFVRGTESKSAVEVGHKYLSELAKRCLVEVVNRQDYNGKIICCKIHDIVRELIIKIAQDGSFATFDEQGRQTFTENSRWIGFNATQTTSSSSLKTRIEIPKLRVFLMLNNALNKKLEFKDFKRLKSLRVLDLSRSRLDEADIKELFQWITYLKRLTCLNLSEILDLKLLPCSIRKLRNLQILVLNRCYNLKKIHHSVTKLKRLMILDLTDCPLEYLPVGLSQLFHLQELSGFMVRNQAKTQHCQLREVLNLKELRVLRIKISDETQISKDEDDILSHLVKLEVLCIDGKKCENKKKEVIEMVSKLRPPPNLLELHLSYYCQSSLPDWVNPTDLSKLQYLSIVIGDLTHLIPKMESNNGHYMTWRLQGLCLRYLPRLEEDWEDLNRCMPELEFLQVGQCFKLKNFPCSVDNNKPDVWRKRQD